MRAALLILGFNRPEKLEKVLEASRTLANERKVYIALDGPRRDRPEDEERVAKCRKKAYNFMKDRQDTYLRVSDDNQGCKNGVVNAINWLFEYEDCGIILEDDCIPSEDFLPYCDSLLSRYRDERQVWMIAGDNSAELEMRHEYSYSFAPEPLIWGWATWRDRWEMYDSEMNDWKLIRSTSIARRIFRDDEQFATRVEVFNRVADGKIDTWDYQLSATMRINRGLCIVPRVNLVTNIGFGRDATHTRNEMDQRSDHPTGSIMPLIHPPCLFVDREIEAQIIERIQGVKYLSRPRKAVRAVRRIVKSWFE